jgi:hypothetical protein
MKAALLAAIALLCACAGPETRVNKAATRIRAAAQDREAPYERKVANILKQAGKLSDQDLSAPKLKTYPDQTLRRLFDGLEEASFYSYGAAPHLPRQERVFEELAARRIATQDDIQDLFQRQLAARAFDKARAFRERFPEAGLWRVPRIIDEAPADAPHRVFDISADSQTATVKVLPVSRGPRIVAAVLGSCPVTTRALKAIEAREPLRRALRELGAAITIRFEPGGVTDFNEKQKSLRLYVVYDRASWPGFDLSMSPTFYFLKDGKIERTIRGWDSGTGESFKEFEDGLRSIGRLP